MELFCFFILMMSLLKFFSTSKMMIMLMSLEMSSALLFFLLVLISSYGGGGFIGVYSIFVVFVVSESVLILLTMINIFRKGSVMIKSLYSLKF